LYVGNQERGKYLSKNKTRATEEKKKVKKRAKGSLEKSRWKELDIRMINKER